MAFHLKLRQIKTLVKKQTMEINRNIEMSVYYRLTLLSSNALVAFVELGIMSLYVIPHIFLAEERLAAQLQERK